MWLSLTIMEAEVSFAYALEAAPLRAARATTREKNFIIIDIIDLLDVCRSIGFVYGMKVQGGKQGGKSKGSSPNLNEPSAAGRPVLHPKYGGIGIIQYHVAVRR